MAILSRHSGGTIIFVTIIASFILSVMPLPSWLAHFRPEWVALCIVYWCLALPQRVGVGTAWVTGIFLDVLRGALLGQHALGLAIVAYLALILHQRIRVYPVWQQSTSILVLITIYQLLVLWINGVAGLSSATWTSWLPALTSMLVWPLVYVVLRALRRGFGVS